MRYKAARDQCDKLLRKLDGAGDELQKFTVCFLVG